MKILRLLFLLISLSMVGNAAFAQFGEPEVLEKETPRNLFDEGFKTGFGFDISLSDFGVGIGGQFRFGLSPYTEALVTLKAASLRDPTEQTFIDYSFGFRTVPDKYKRVLSVPLFVGVKQRLFAEEIADNFRVFTSMSVGPVYAVSYPYFQDINDNGIRENDRRVFGYTERVNDVFRGWDESEEHWGFGGEIVIGIDFGDKFKNLSSVEFGYTMNYFKDGIQVLEPCHADISRINQLPNNPCGVGPIDIVQVFPDGFAPLEKANGPRSYFGSAQISFVFGWMW